MVTDYTAPFRITATVGNNALSYERRGASPSLWVPSLISGTIHDVRPGERVVFEDFDEHDTLQSCTGLAHLVTTTLAGIPAAITDNHNHAFYFWCDALTKGTLRPGATLIHIDQHKDMRVPERMYTGRSIEEAFDYTNFHLNVGNYIVPAQQAGIVGETQFVTSGEALNTLSLASHTNKILNLDLDFFAPEMSYINFDAARRFIDTHLRTTSFITVATSPFFIDQARAIDTLHRLFR